MIDFWQTDPRLLPKINTFGCALLDSIYLSPVQFEPSDVNEMYNSLLQVGFIDEDCTIKDWESVLNSVSPHFSFKEKQPKQTYACGPHEKEIIKWYLSNVKEDHFTVGDGWGAVKWDSMNRSDIMKAYATFVEKVIITVS